MRILRHRKSTTKIKWYNEYGGLGNEGGYRWFDPLGSPKRTCFLLIMHFAKVRYNRADRHPGHRNKRRNSTIIFVSNGSGTETLRQIQPAKGK